MPGAQGFAEDASAHVLVAQSGTWTVGISAAQTIGLAAGAAIIGAVTQSGTWTVAQGGAAAGSGAWPVTVTTSGDVVVKPGDSGNNAVRVNIVAGSAGGVSVTDEATWTFATSVFAPGGGVFNDSADILDSGEQGTVRLTTNRAYHVNLRDASANQLLGQAAMAASIPVTVASNQSAFPVSQSGSNWSVNVAQIGASALAFGQANMAGSIPVVLASNQASIPVTGSGTFAVTESGTWDVSGGGVDEAAWTFATSHFQPVGGVFNDSADILDSGEQGTFRATTNRALHVNLRDASANQLLVSKTSANSVPVVIASDQGSYTVAATISGTWNVGLSTGTNVVGSVASVGASASVGTALSFYNNTAFTNTVVAVKGSAGKLYGMRIYHNTDTTDYYVQVFNKTTGNVTLGTTTPDDVFIVPAAGSATKGGFYDYAIGGDIGANYGTAISAAFTTTATGNTAPTTNGIVSFYYI